MVGTVLCAAVLTIFVAVGATREIRWLLLVGTALLAIDAKAPYLYDQMMNAVGQPALARGDLLYELGVVLDEAMELAGWTLLAVGLWDAALAVRVSEGDPRTSRGAVQLLRDLNE